MPEIGGEEFRRWTESVARRKSGYPTYQQPAGARSLVGQVNQMADQYQNMPWDMNRYGRFATDQGLQSSRNLSDIRSALGQRFSAGGVTTGQNLQAIRTATQDELLRSALARQQGFQHLNAAQADWQRQGMVNALQTKMGVMGPLQSMENSQNQFNLQAYQAQIQKEMMADQARKQMWGGLVGTVGKVLGGVTGGLLTM